MLTCAAHAFLLWQVQSLGSSSGEAAPCTSDSGSSGAGVMLEVGSGTVALLAPALPQLSHLLGQPMELWQLLRACAECGLQLTPGSREAAVAGLQEKDAAMEGAMCADLALLWWVTQRLTSSSRLVGEAASHVACGHQMAARLCTQQHEHCTSAVLLQIGSKTCFWPRSVAANVNCLLATACSGNFLVASSRWNRAAGAGAALVRLSEVTDWEEGGRTAAEHAARIFRREAAEGERRVLVARRQVRTGCYIYDLQVAERS
jgi:hypothetical protein